MSSVFKKTGISEQEQREISSIVFVKLAESGDDLPIRERNRFPYRC